MADPINFEGVNANYKPAPGNEGDIGELPSFRSDNGEVISCWKLTEDEIAHVVMTGEVWASQLVGRDADARLQPLRISGRPLMRYLDDQPYLSGGELDERTKGFLTGGDE